MSSNDDPDVKTLAHLKKAGSNLTKPHLFDFFLYLPNQDTADEIAQRLGEDGYQTEIRPSSTDTTWLCLASKIIFPNVEMLIAIRDHFEELVTPLGGNYDGWETRVEE